MSTGRDSFARRKYLLQAFIGDEINLIFFAGGNIGAIFGASLGFEL